MFLREKAGLCENRKQDIIKLGQKVKQYMNTIAKVLVEDQCHYSFYATLSNSHS